ncbi:nucleoside recognition domain-containing protein [Rhizorhabdus argentea]|uniref:nucleoside recognition domain-containing protein n=1 Tax=Rhizorhabdus argentea TaxID=1387174 RepID=UPI0030ED4DDA
MKQFIDILLEAGRGAIDVALYTLLPIMVVMMIAMRMLEASGLLDRLTRLASPLLRPFGLGGLALLAMLQISLVSFVAPIATLALMQDRGESDRRIAGTFAAVMAMAPANAVFPLAAMGLNSEHVMLLSVMGGLAAGAVTYWVLARHLSDAAEAETAFEEAALDRPGVLKIINVSGREAIDIVINIIPMLLLSLAMVATLRHLGAITALAGVVGPDMDQFGIAPSLILPAVTKLLAGSTALVGVVHQMYQAGQIDAAAINSGANALLHPVDLPGVAIYASASTRMGRCAVPAVLGGVIGIVVRCLAAALLA